MTVLDIIAYHTIYNVRLSKLVCALPIPRKVKLRFVRWQFLGMTALAVKKISEAKP